MPPLSPHALHRVTLLLDQPAGLCSETLLYFGIVSDGSRAIFSFTNTNWDAIFGTISLRDMNDKLNAVLDDVNTLKQDLYVAQADLNATRAELNATRAELDAFKAQQAVCC